MLTEQLQKDASGRYPAIDIFRGAAIFTMLAANAAAESLAAPHPYAMRVYGSFAAPVFVFLAGLMAGMGARQNPPARSLVRGLMIVLVAALMDVLIWRILPFTTFDVLYLIALGVPVAVFTMRLPVNLRVLLCLLFLAGGPALQHFAYDEQVHEFALSGFSLSGLPDGIGWWLRSLLLDGWFPVFPWLGILLAGTLMLTHGSFVARRTVIFFPLGLLLFTAGITWLYFYPPIEAREGYSELFYPPGLPYLLAAAGVIILGTSVLKYLRPRYGLQLLEYLGACSLFIYIVHSAVISFVLDRYFTELTLGRFLLMYAGFAVIMIAVAWALSEVKKKPLWRKVPKTVRFVFGG